MNPKPVTWDGVEYASQGALARAKGVSRQRVHQWLAVGYKGDADIGTRLNGRPPWKREQEDAK